MKITLKEISELTGLSISVLSRVASGSGYVSEEKRLRAEQALEEYGYHRSLPHAAASPLMDDVILVISGSTDSSYQWLIRQLTACAHKHNKRVLIANTSYNNVLEEEYLRFAQRLGVYGIVMLSIPEKQSTIHLIRDCKIPFVLAFRYLSTLPTDTVTMDSYEMGIIAAKEFIAAGHTRIAYLGGQADSSITRDKQLGFTDQLREAGIDLPQKWISYGALDYQSGVEYARQLLAMEEAPTAIFISYDMMAVGLMDTLLREGVRIPEDLSIISCGKTLLSETYPIRLTRLSILGAENYAPTIMRLLNARSKDPSRPRRMIMFEPEYIPGTTVSAPRERAALK